MSEDRVTEGGTFDPDEDRLFTLDWTTKLASISEVVGETVTITGTPTWSVLPAGPVIGVAAYAPTVSADGKKTSFWIRNTSAATPGTRYLFKVNVTLSDTPASTRDWVLALIAEDT